jgi:hypothetical protein
LEEKQHFHRWNEPELLMRDLSKKITKKFTCFEREKLNCFKREQYAITKQQPRRSWWFMADAWGRLYLYQMMEMSWSLEVIFAL